MSNKGISAIMVSLILLAVSLGMAVAYASTMMGWFGGAINIVKIDTSDSKIILNPSTNHIRIQIVIRNMGTTTIKIKSVSIDTENQKVNVTFSGNNNVEINGIGLFGSVYGSSKDVIISSGCLLIPQGCIATIYAEEDVSASPWKLGNTYRGTIFYDGGITDFKISVIY
ncbi:MAG: hypothetical protein QXI93_00305 [Candidatus Methanomethylicia archaeon]